MLKRIQLSCLLAGLSLGQFPAHTEESQNTKEISNKQEILKIKLDTKSLKRDSYRTGLANPNCHPFSEPQSQACTGGALAAQELSQNERLLGELVQLGIRDWEKIGRDPGNYILDTGSEWILSRATGQANEALQSIPFFAQTSIGIDFTTGSSTSINADSLLKLATLGTDADGLPKGLIFGQGRWSGAWGQDGSTLNAGLGTRYRISDDAMIGLNGFWDYRIKTESTSHSRFGVGIEGFYKDFEVRNNWYFAGTSPTVISETNYEITYERIVPGWDVELGYRMPSYPELAFYVKGFRWDYISRNDNSGIGGGVNWQITPNINLDAQVSNEIPAYFAYMPPAGNGDVYANFKIKYTFEPVRYSRKNYALLNTTRMSQPVRRRYDILLERYSKKKKQSSSSGPLSVRITGVAP